MRPPRLHQGLKGKRAMKRRAMKVERVVARKKKTVISPAMKRRAAAQPVMPGTKRVQRVGKLRKGIRAANNKGK